MARLLACDADLVPVTVDPDGNPLDVGRTHRLFTGALRTALEVRDRGCAWPGCDRPVSWTQAHHIVAWQDGGKTSLDNGVLLCLFHHHEIEKGDWTVFIRRGRAWFTHPRGSTRSKPRGSTPCTTHHRANDRPGIGRIPDRAPASAAGRSPLGSVLPTTTHQ